MNEPNSALVLRDGWAFLPRELDGDVEYWVSGTALAEKLGREPRKVRSAVRELEADSEICGVLWRPESGRQRTGHPGSDGQRIYDFDECYLPEEAVYLVIMRVRSDTAKVLRQEFARTLKAVRRGKLGQEASEAMVRLAPESCEMIGEATARRIGPVLATIQDEQHRQGHELARLRTDVDGLKESNLRCLDAKRKNPSKLTQKLHLDYLYASGGKCPCCGGVDLFTEGRFVGHIDHNFKVSDASLVATWPVCPECNERLKSPVFREERQAEFKTYHRRRSASSGPLFSA